MSTFSRKKALFKKTIAWLAAGAVPFVITACYGPPDGKWNPSSFGSVVNSETGEGVEGIKVSCLDDQEMELISTVTDLDGNFSIEQLPECVTVRFTDEDGEDNDGTFISQDVPLIDVDNEDVELEKEDS